MPVLCLGVVAAVVILESLIGLGRIPGAGPVLWGLLSPVTFAGSLLAGLVVVFLVYTLPIYVPLIVLDRSRPVDTLKTMLALHRAHGFSLVGLISLTVMAVTCVVGLIFVPLLYVSTQLTTEVGKATMGKQFASVFFSTPDAFSHGWFGFIQLLYSKNCRLVWIQPMISAA